MERILHLAGSLYALYRDDLVISLLACTVLLMIIALFAVRRCRRQIRELTEKTGEMTKVALSQSGREFRRENEMRRPTETAESVSPAKLRKNEEVFGNVIHEIFP